MSTTLQHRGYDGSVEYSGEDKMLHGRVLGIHDVISYGGISVREVEKNFCDAVDEYLAFCERRGKKPNAPFKGTIKVRLSPDLHHKAAQYAEEHDMNLNAVVKTALDSYLSTAD